MGKLRRTVFDIAGALAALGLVAGCAGVHEPYARPAIELPAAWAGQAAAPEGSWPAAEWWTNFGSEELDALVAAAQANNHDLKAAAARVAQSRALTQVAGARLAPVITADASARRSRFSGSATANSFSVDLGAAWDPDLSGANRHARDSAAAGLLASRHGQDALRLDLTADVAAAYFQILALNDNLKVARDTLANVRRLLAVIESQKRAGKISALELEQQRTVLANAEASIPPLLQQRRTTLDTLALLTGRNPEAMVVSDRLLDSISVPPVPLGLPSRLLEQRPDIRQVEAALVGAHADVGAARAALLPQLQLSARGGATAAALGRLLDSGNVLTSIGVDLLATIFDGGRRSGLVDLSLARQRELVENYRQTVLSAFRDVEDALAGVEHFAAQETAQRQAQVHAREAYRLAEIRYRAGAAEFLTVLDAQRALINADAVLSNTRFARFAALVALYRALGGGWQASTESANAAS